LHGIEKVADCNRTQSSLSDFATASEGSEQESRKAAASEPIGGMDVSQLEVYSGTCSIRGY
jgi:hypothetical protein